MHSGSEFETKVSLLISEMMTREWEKRLDFKSTNNTIVNAGKDQIWSDHSVITLNFGDYKEGVLLRKLHKLRTSLKAIWVTAEVGEENTEVIFQLWEVLKESSIFWLAIRAEELKFLNLNSKAMNGLSLMAGANIQVFDLERIIFNNKYFWRVFSAIWHIQRISFTEWKFSQLKRINLGDAFSQSSFLNLSFNDCDITTVDLQIIIEILGRYKTVRKTLEALFIPDWVCERKIKESLRLNEFKRVEIED
jgi:hypothetical protein